VLDQKREVLLEELIDVHRETTQLRRVVEAELSAVCAALRAALLAGGRALLEAEALAAAGGQALRLRERSVMGVIVPLLEVETSEPPEPVSAPGWTPADAAVVRRRIRALLEPLVRLAENEVSCRRLAAELQKTQRRVNALEQMFIPEYRDTIHFVEATLEEREREGLFQLKRLKGGVDHTGQER
jgi:V/A-type H+-transporting ATPase subunit D